MRDVVVWSHGVHSNKKRVLYYISVVESCALGKKPTMVSHAEPPDLDMAMSVDFGITATAVVIGYPNEVPPVITDLMVYAPGQIPVVKDAVTTMRRMFNSLPTMGTYLFEEQCKINKDTPLMEAALGGLAASVPGALVVHVPVTRVANEFSLPSGKSQKKKQATLITKRLMNDHTKLRVAKQGLHCFRVIIY